MRRVGVAMARNMHTTAVLQGRSVRRSELYAVSYVEPLHDATCLREAASANSGNDAGRVFQHPARQA